MKAPFWKTKSLAAMSDSEWESLCDGCGKCCLHKLEDDDGRVHLTVVACRLLDIETSRCSNYAERKKYVPECTRVRPRNVRSLALPGTCAYRLVAEGKDLPAWHPLVTGKPMSTRDAGMSVSKWAISENDVEGDDYESYVLGWSLDDGDGKRLGTREPHER